VAAPPPAAAPVASAALKTEDTNIAGVVADVTECARKDGVLSVRVRFRNTSAEKKNLNLIDNRNYEKYYLTAASKKYFILKDSEGTYLTPQASPFGGLSPSLEPGSQYTWWAKYPRASSRSEGGHSLHHGGGAARRNSGFGQVRRSHAETAWSLHDLALALGGPGGPCRRL
jgi:hypothetical protein